MPKFNVEFDTDTNEVSLAVDGQQLNVDCITVSKYNMTGCGENPPYNEYYISYGKDLGNGESVSYSYTYCDKDQIGEQFMATKLHENVNKAAKLDYLSYKVRKALSKS